MHLHVTGFSAATILVFAIAPPHHTPGNSRYRTRCAYAS
jgi:hypothetical protein